MKERPRVRSSDNAGVCQNQRSKQTYSKKGVYYGESTKSMSRTRKREYIMENLQKAGVEVDKESILWRIYKKQE